MHEKQSWLNSLNKTDRIAFVSSVLWIVIVILFVIRYNGDELVVLLNIFYGGGFSLCFCTGVVDFGLKDGSKLKPD